MVRVAEIGPDCGSNVPVVVRARAAPAAGRLPISRRAGWPRDGTALKPNICSVAVGFAHVGGIFVRTGCRPVCAPAALAYHIS